MRKKPEDGVLRACRDYLKLRGWSVWRINNRGVRIRGTDRWMFKGSKGLPDLLCAKRIGGQGTVIAVETKAKRGRLSPHQIEFRNDWQNTGNSYYMVRSAMDLKRSGI